MTAQELDYHEVFSRLAVIDGKAAEQLLGLATVLLEVDRQIGANTQATGWRKADRQTATLLRRYKVITDEIDTLHQWLVGSEEKEGAYAGEVGQNSSAGPFAVTDSL